MPAFSSGQLRANEIFSAIFNMIISQEVFANNVKHNYQLVDKFRVDGSMYGDTKLFYATDVLKSRNWGGDSGAGNLLNINRPKNPECQAITITNFRQIDLTVDNYLSKRAWSTEGAFSSFTSVMLGWIKETEKIYMATKFNAWLGTQKSSTGAQTIDLDLPDYSESDTNVETEAKARRRAQLIAQRIANLFDELKDYSRDYNDYRYVRSYDPNELIVIWNTKYANEITKLDLPTMFHQVGIEKFEEEKLPARFFGTALTSSNKASYTSSTTAGAPGKPITSAGLYDPGTAHANGCIRALQEIDVTVSSNTYHLFPGDEIPTGASLATLTETLYVNGSSGNSVTNNLYYVQDNDVICKVVHKRSIPFMSAFETGTSFFNPISLTENHYLTWGFSDLEYLKNYPFITINED